MRVERQTLLSACAQAPRSIVVQLLYTKAARCQELPDPSPPFILDLKILHVRAGVSGQEIHEQPLEAGGVVQLDEMARILQLDGADFPRGRQAFEIRERVACSVH